MTRRLLLLLLSALAFASGCICTDQTQLLEDFEDTCGDVPCAWTVERGTVELTATFHENSRGLRVGADALLRRRIAYQPTTPPRLLQVTARCEPEAAVRLRLLEGASPTATSPRTSLVLDVRGTEGGELFDVYEEPGTWSGSAPLELELEGGGFGSCIIDDIAVVSENICG